MLRKAFCLGTLLLLFNSLAESNPIQLILGNVKERIAYPVLSGNGRFIAFATGGCPYYPPPNENPCANRLYLFDKESHQIAILLENIENHEEFRDLALSENGQFLAFSSALNTLVPNDTNEASDVFVLEIQSGHIRRVSVSSGGEQGNGDSAHPAISANGKIVVFDSFATNLVSEDNNQWQDVFMHHTGSALTTAISVSSDGQLGNGDSRSPSISANGKKVVFSSHASNLDENDQSQRWNTFLRDTNAEITSQVDVSNEGKGSERGSYGSMISGNGRFVVLDASEDILPDTFRSRKVLKDIVLNRYIEIQPIKSTFSTSIRSVSKDGRFVLLNENSYINIVWNSPPKVDAFVYDRLTDTIRTIPNTQSMSIWSGQISADGSTIVFTVEAENPDPKDTNRVYHVFWVKNPFLVVGETIAVPALRLLGMAIMILGLGTLVLSRRKP